MGLTCCTAEKDDEFDPMHIPQYDDILFGEDSDESRQRRITEGGDVQGELRLALASYFEAQKDYTTTKKKMEKVEPEVYFEIRKYQKPPEVLRHILTCMAIMLGEEDIEWPQIQVFLLHCKEKLYKFDIDSVPRKQVTKSKLYAKEIPEFKDPEKIKYTSETAEIIFAWLKSIWRMDKERHFLQKHGMDYKASNQTWISQTWISLPGIESDLSCYSADLSSYSDETRTTSKSIEAEESVRAQY